MASMDGGGKGSKKDGVGGGIVCAHCKKAGELGAMKQCSRCRSVTYCSVECQKKHWKLGGHKGVCVKGDSDTAHGGATGGGTTAGVGPPLKHPCPVCLDNEDDSSGFGMCFNCGQLYCGGCRDSLATTNDRGVTHCPTCRASIQASEVEIVRRLRRLLARPPGRHTRVALHSLAVQFQAGWGVAKDLAEAARLFRRSADEGHARAFNSLGALYANGWGVGQDDAEAVRLFRLGAELGDMGSQHHLGVFSERGQGVAQDDAVAARFFRLAADQEFPQAQHSLGSCYFLGKGVPQNPAEGARLWRLAAKQGHAESISLLASLGPFGL